MPLEPLPDFPPDPAALAAFEAAVRAIGRDPADPWIGGYVAYEWRFLRAVLAAYGVTAIRADGTPLRVLEFGCNVGASAVVMGLLGAQVTGVEVDAGYADVARANAALHRMAERVAIHHVADTRTLPFADGAFDLVLANSVLEYVPPARLGVIMAELARVTAPAGRLLVLGTASRLVPREIHSRRWLVNYWPAALDRLVAGRPLQRGLSPFTLAKALRPHFAVVDQDRWLTARAAVHGHATLAMRLVARIARLFGIAPGWLSPHIELMARRRD